MKRIIFTAIAASLTAVCALASRPSVGSLSADSVKIAYAADKVHVTSRINLSDLSLRPNHSIFVTPILSDNQGNSQVLPSVMINGRNMHYVYERHAYSADVLRRYTLASEIRRRNGDTQTAPYEASADLQPWMLASQASLSFVYDTCGCGHMAGTSFSPAIPLNLNPAPQMRLVQITPAVTELPVSIHEGKARVQFEVDRTELHVEPYRCKSGQLIDNREQLAIIEDSVRYALSDPNVEIARIEICGYASPESPYEHNDYLATNRSRVLADYIGDRFSLPRDVRAYSAVPENWVEFRQQTLTATDITEQQRADLLELIDAPTYGPADFDAKERALRTDPKFARLFADKILPEWFPRYRATKFMISTRLKPMTDEKLAQVILHSPEMLSLNQMMRVARLYPENSAMFNRTIETALKYYPESTDANLNAAVTALRNGDLDRAQALLVNAGNSPEAENARGVLATHRLDFSAARAHFQAALPLPEAAKNLEMLP